jgi:hypothetical protein
MSGQMNEDIPWWSTIATMLKTELEKPQLQRDIIYPVIHVVLGKLIPYILLFLGALAVINFFVTMLAIGLVLYFTNKK